MVDKNQNTPQSPDIIRQKILEVESESAATMLVLQGANAEDGAAKDQQKQGTPKISYFNHWEDGRTPSDTDKAPEPVLTGT